MGRREIIFDTETTGLDPHGGDRITELGCVEVVNQVPTGKDLRILINPERDIPAEVTKVTGHTWERLKDKPKFADAADLFLEFVQDSTLVAHNADFDRGFINMELKRCGKAEIEKTRFIDTITIARKKFPGALVNLDALCKRFDISLDGRTKHGALTDAYLLAEVYLELNGGREQSLGFAGRQTAASKATYPTRSPRPRALQKQISDTEQAAHARFVSEMKEPLWHSLGLLKDEDLARP